jgi:hypothetical protein
VGGFSVKLMHYAATAGRVWLQAFEIYTNPQKIQM